MRYYAIFAVILALIIAVVTAVIYFVTKRNGNRKSPFLIFAAVDIILAFIVGAAVLFFCIADKSFGSSMLAAAYIFFWLPVAAALGIFSAALHFVFKGR